MIDDLIIYEIRFYIGDIKRKNNFSEEELSAIKSIEIYASKHLVGAKTANMAAIKSIMGANSKVRESGIYGNLPVFKAVYDFCRNELGNSELTQRQTVTHKQENKDNKNKKSELRTVFKYFIVIPFVVILFALFFNIVLERREHEKHEDIHERPTAYVTEVPQDIPSLDKAANRRKLFEALSEEYDMGDFEQFCEDIKDDTKRKKLYDAIINEYYYGDYEDFSAHILDDIQKPKPKEKSTKAKDNLSSLYNGLIRKGYSASDIGDEATFRAKMADKNNRKQLYEYVSSRGDFRIGDYETYEKILSAQFADNVSTKKKQPASRPKPVEPSFIETHFATGDAPFKDFFGRGEYDYNSLSELKIINYSSSDAVVLLEHSIKGIIRNVFVKKDFTYTIRNIPEGICIVKIMHGNSWNKEKDNGSGLPKGGFMKNVSFEKTKWSDPFDFTFEEDNDGISYPTYSITLHKVRNGNLQTERIDEESFWN